MILNQAGQLVLDVWNNLPGRFSRLNLDAFIIMPNHVHGILIFPGTIARSAGSSPNIRKRDSKSNPRSQPQCPSQNNVGSGLALPQEKACLSLENLKTSSAEKSGKMSETCTNPKEEYSLGEVVGAFKSLSTREINKRFNRSGPIWQPNYYEHVIRNERSLNLAREYIINNPAKWAYDKENPTAY
ncbi:transposase [Desulfatibacillum alkenivorans]|jgi:REP element-mobilizing transposase RayT|nr:transposase [Desulfatibacillum alkenivorans]